MEPDERLKYILSRSYLTWVASYMATNGLLDISCVGYVYVVLTSNYHLIVVIPRYGYGAKLIAGTIVCDPLYINNRYDIHTKVPETIYLSLEINRIKYGAVNE